MIDPQFPYRPWPKKGKWFRFERNWAACVNAEPPYDTHYPVLEGAEPERISVRFGRWWFWAADCPLFHFHFGYTPVTLDDPGFYWRDHPFVLPWRESGKLFVVWSQRWGLGPVKE